MRKLVALFTALVLIASFSRVALAGENAPVQYTFTFTDLGQGAHGGGRLYADGRAEGGLTLAVLDGQAIVRVEATSWSAVVPGEAVDICFETQQIKGPPVLPPSFCFSQVGLPLPVTGTAIIISNPFGDLALIRVTPAN